jgi:SNF family Na+-dependent transporter
VAFPKARDPNTKNPVMFKDSKNKFRDKCLPRLYYTSSNITKITADSLAASRAREFFYVDVVQYFGRDTCLPYNDETDGTRFSWPSFGACIFVWATIFLAIFNGVQGSSYVVWITVPIPLIFIVVMMVRGLLLPGAFNGISQYI